MKKTILLGIACGLCLSHGGLHAAWQTQTPTQTQPATPAIPTPTVPTTTPPGMVPPAGLPSNVQYTRRVDDGKFVSEETLNGLTEIELGKLAAQKSSDDAVKKFAGKMIEDQGKIDGQLKQVAEGEKLPVPDALDAKHQKRIDQLSKRTGESFDKAYIKDQIEYWEIAVKHFGAEAHAGSKANVMALAQTTLPTLKQNLANANELKKSRTEK